MQRDSDFYLNQAIITNAPPGAAPGASGYFSAPQRTLDPRLFNGEVMKPGVRQFILDTFYGFWRGRYNRPESWSTVWAAGSGITYQWAGDRGNGDLDILVGVDFARFYGANDSYAGISEKEMAGIFNDELREELWPSTADWEGFEITFYINPGATDIRNINPYAAYNITANVWTVRPPVLPEDPRSLYPAEFRKAAEAEQAQARQLVERYKALKAQAEAMAPGSPGWRNALAAQRLVVDQAKTLYDSIHLGRRQAFGPGGSGYGDYYNYRWQQNKANGTIAALSAIAGVGKQSREAYETATYGAPVASAEDVLTRAALWNRGRR